LRYFAYRRLPFEIFILAISCIILSYISWIKIPFANIMWNHLSVAQAVLGGIKISRPFCPIGYSAFLILSLRYGGLNGVFLCQAFLYIITVILSYFALRLLKVGRRIAFWMCVMILVHPYLSINIKKIFTNNLGVPLMVAFIFVILWIKRYGLGYFSAVLSGLLFGYMIIVRPDFAILAPIPIYLFLNQQKLFLKKKISLLIIIVTLSLLVIVIITKSLTGHFVPAHTTYAAYNFFGGANPFTEESLINEYHIEASIGKALESLNMNFDNPYNVSFNHPELEKVFWQESFSYIKNHPFHYLYLCVLKLATLFRPDYRQVYTSNLNLSPYLLIIIQTILALPVFIWLLVRLHCCYQVSAHQPSMIIPLVAMLYIVPFILIGPDPRYRLPIDIILILDSAYCLDILKKNRIRVGKNI
jgi:hypothetical protein